MASPVPKDPKERRNRITPTRGEWVDIQVRSLSEPAVPPLKEVVGAIAYAQYSSLARRKWRKWITDPVTTWWTDNDIEFALSTLELYNVNDWTRNAAEIRLRETSLALNPRGKRDQRFRITFGIGTEATKETPLPDNVVQIDDRMSHLAHGA